MNPFLKLAVLRDQLQLESDEKKLADMLAEQRKLLSQKPKKLSVEDVLKNGGECDVIGIGDGVKQSRYSVRDAMGRDVYIYARSRAKAQSIVNEIFNGRYSLRCV